MSYFVAEEHGLEHVGSVDWLRGHGFYEWQDTTVLYHRETDMFYWEFAGGCSCNMPLEYVKSIADLEFGSFFDLCKHLSETALSYKEDDEEGVLALEVTRVIEAAMRIQERK